MANKLTHDDVINNQKTINYLAEIVEDAVTMFLIHSSVNIKA